LDGVFLVDPPDVKQILSAEFQQKYAEMEADKWGLKIVYGSRSWSQLRGMYFSIAS
jgi:hypothetical protein